MYSAGTSHGLRQHGWRRLFHWSGANPRKGTGHPERHDEKRMGQAGENDATACGRGAAGCRPPRKAGRAGGEVAWGLVDSHREHKEPRE